MPSIDSLSAFFMERIANVNTRRTYQYMFNTFFDIVPRDRDIKEVTTIDIQRYINSQIARQLRPYTIYKRHKEIKAFLNWCVDMRFINENPAKAIKIKQPKIAINERKVLPLDKILKLINYLEVTQDVKVLAIVRFLADTGCRRMGLANLQIHDLDLVGCRAYVLEKARTEENDPYTVHFSEKTRDALLAWLAIRPEVDHPFVFTGDNPDKGMTAPSIAQLIRRRAKKSGIGSYGTHVFRRSKGYRAFGLGAQDIVVAGMLGHRDDGQVAKRHYSDYSDPMIEHFARLTLIDDADQPTTDTNQGNIIPFRRRQ